MAIGHGDESIEACRTALSDAVVKLLDETSIGERARAGAKCIARERIGSTLFTCAERRLAREREFFDPVGLIGRELATGWASFGAADDVAMHNQKLWRCA